ncbi:U-box domain-containing protein 2 [Dorcoceras hygrometricum]|uniref:U-box domain-containing protein 2 n=1 Tax=Dorcoceras hygrometricum TaxID=472368 RepID=A0A2Z6ZW82_9LAMI|nr:U-box domain-containing protein 2 [Dorcoceras hygrometricum]
MGFEGGSSSTGGCHPTAAATSFDADADADAAATCASISPSYSPSVVSQTFMLLQSDEHYSRLQAAKDIRRMTKTSQRYRRHFSAAVVPLVDMLCCGDADASEAALAALLNLAVKDERSAQYTVCVGFGPRDVSFLL